MTALHHQAGFISLTLKNGNVVTVRVSNISAISTIGNDGVSQILLSGGCEITVREKIHEIFERIDAYIAPEWR